MTAWVKVGAKCVCTKKSPWTGVAFGYVMSGPVDKEECTITSVMVSETTGRVIIELVGHKYLYNSAWFKPVAYPKQSEETDVALFTHHLTDQPVDA